MLERRPYPKTPASNHHPFMHPYRSFPGVLHAVSYTSPHLPLEFLLVLSPELAGLDVGSAFVVGASEHTDNREEDRLGRKDW